jgi:hypothetical protein
VLCRSKTFHDQESQLPYQLPIVFITSVCTIIISIIINMASPASKARSGFGGSGGGDVESGDGGEQFVDAHIVDNGDGAAKTVKKPIIAAPFDCGDAVVIPETGRHPPPPSYYVNDPNVRVIPGAAATPPEPSLSGLAVASLGLGCVAAGIMLMSLLFGVGPWIDILSPLLAIIFGSVALCQIKKSRRQQLEGEVVRQWRGQWQAITGIVLGSIVLSLQIAFLVFVAIVYTSQS